jgi:1,4-alpha-glucan branching enzyme
MRRYSMATVKSEKKIKRKKVTFSIDLSDANEVILMGDFNNWDPKKHLMKRDRNGVWNKAVILPPGSYEYKFLVDGQWKEDPQNDRTCLNCFGSYNNIINLTVP